MNVVRSLYRDEAGFIISAELILVFTILVIGLIVGWAQIQSAMLNELNDVASAIGSLNQSFYISGSFVEVGGCLKAFFRGSFYIDRKDSFDDTRSLDCDPPLPELP